MTAAPVCVKLFKVGLWGYVGIVPLATGFCAFIPFTRCWDFALVRCIRKTAKALAPPRLVGDSWAFGSALTACRWSPSIVPKQSCSCRADGDLRVSQGRRDFGGVKSFRCKDSMHLWHDLNGGVVCGQIPDILQVLIGEGNATVGPVACLVIRNWLREPIRLSMDKDIPARTQVQCGGSLQVRRAGVGNVQRLEVMAVFQAKIDDVSAFGRAKVPLVLFSAGRTEAKCNAITAQRIMIMQ